MLIGPKVWHLAAELAGSLPTGGVSGLPAPAPDYFLWPHLLKVGVILTGMVGVLVLVLQLVKRFKLAPGGTMPLIKVLARHYVAPKQVLLLVAVERQRFLLASAPDRLTLLTALPLQESPTPREADGTLDLTVKPREGRVAEK